ncbi:MAG: hypothetical protein AAF456_02945 [Planctomycetota bacterium]
MIRFIKRTAVSCAMMVALFASHDVIAQNPFSGQWQCSCGSVWSLSASGSNIQGRESGSGGNGTIAGTSSGNQFRFQYNS